MGSETKLTKVTYDNEDYKDIIEGVVEKTASGIGRRFDFYYYIDEQKQAPGFPDLHSISSDYVTKEPEK